MAFGIDDALEAAAAAIKITETLVETLKRYQNNKEDYDLKRLLEEVRLTVLSRIDDADLMLSQFERTLVERNIDIKRSLNEVIAATPFWKPFEQYRLRSTRRSFNNFSDSVYSAIDDIAALLRCRERTKEMGAAVVASSSIKHDLHEKILNASSLREAIALLRAQLARHKIELGGA